MMTMIVNGIKLTVSESDGGYLVHVGENYFWLHNINRAMHAATLRLLVLCHRR